jgi:hypothetical protein
VAVAVLGVTGQVHGDVLDHGHVVRPEAGSKAREVVMEDDVEDPVQAVLDAPMGSDGGGEKLCIELDGREVVALLALDFSGALGGGLDHGDHGQAREQALLGKVPLRNQPVDLVADDMVALFEAAVVGIGGVERLAGGCVGPIGKEGLNFCPEGWPVVLQREQIIAAAVDDGLGDLDLGSDRIDGDEDPFSSKRLSNRGIATISLDLSVTASCPNTRRWRLAQAETRVQGLAPPWTWRGSVARFCRRSQRCPDRCRAGSQPTT